MFSNLQLMLSVCHCLFIILLFASPLNGLANSRKLVNLQTLLVGGSGLSLQNMFMQLNCTKLN